MDKFCDYCTIDACTLCLRQIMMRHISVLHAAQPVAASWETSLRLGLGLLGTNACDLLRPKQKEKRATVVLRLTLPLNYCRTDMRSAVFGANPRLGYLGLYGRKGLGLPSAY